MTSSIAFVLLASLAAFQPAAGTPASDILHYVRSNQDGTKPEHVVQYRPSRTSIAVYKWVEKCTTAAYVTAEMHDDLRQGRVFVAGKVARDGTHATFGTLTLDRAGGALDTDLTPPGGSRIQHREPLKSQPFIIYDFDFADLNAFLQEHRPRSDFDYALPVVWPGPDGLFRDYGVLRASFVGEEEHLGRNTLRFDLKVDGPTPSAGRLWVDSASGFIVEAELGLPNHQEYSDFRLKLERVEEGSDAAWAALTRSQYADCPTGN